MVGLRKRTCVVVTISGNTRRTFGANSLRIITGVFPVISMSNWGQPGYTPLTLSSSLNLVVSCSSSSAAASSSFNTFLEVRAGLSVRGRLASGCWLLEPRAVAITRGGLCDSRSFSADTMYGRVPLHTLVARWSQQSSPLAWHTTAHPDGSGASS